MITLKEARENVGRGVVYRPPGRPDKAPEDGVITGCSSRWVFVRYSTQHPGANGQATAPEHLEFLS